MAQSSLFLRILFLESLFDFQNKCPSWSRHPRRLTPTRFSSSRSIGRLGRRAMPPRAPFSSGEHPKHQREPPGPPAGASSGDGPQTPAANPLAAPLEGNSPGRVPSEATASPQRRARDARRLPGPASQAGTETGGRVKLSTGATCFCILRKLTIGVTACLIHGRGEVSPAAACVHCLARNRATEGPPPLPDAELTVSDCVALGQRPGAGEATWAGSEADRTREGPGARPCCGREAGAADTGGRRGHEALLAFLTVIIDFPSTQPGAARGPFSRQFQHVNTPHRGAGRQGELAEPRRVYRADSAVPRFRP